MQTTAFIASEFFSVVSSKVRRAGATLLSANPNLIRPIGQDRRRMEVEPEHCLDPSLPCLPSLPRPIQVFQVWPGLSKLVQFFLTTVSCSIPLTTQRQQCYIHLRLHLVFFLSHTTLNLFLSSDDDDEEEDGDSDSDDCFHLHPPNWCPVSIPSLQGSASCSSASPRLPTRRQS